jgi:hypothetical protein
MTTDSNSRAQAAERRLRLLPRLMVLAAVCVVIYRVLQPEPTPEFLAPVVPAPTPASSIPMLTSATAAEPPAPTATPTPMPADTPSSPPTRTSVGARPFGEDDLHASALARQQAQEVSYRQLRGQGLLAGDDAPNRIRFDDLMRTRLYRKPPPVYPAKLRELNGKVVRIRGFMSPFDSLTDLRNFMLLETPTGCYFCAPPGPTQVVFVRLAGDKPLEFINEAIDVEGTLKLWEADSKEPRHDTFLYVIDAIRLTRVTPDP